MSAALPLATTCCDPCESPVSVAVPGPQGEAGPAGAAGSNGVNAFTLFTANWTIPAELASAVAAVADTSWIAVNQIVYAAKADGSVIGYFQATAIGGATSVTLKNLEDAATGAYAGNSAPGTIITTGGKLCPGGMQGPGGTTSGAASGDLKGTYPGPKIAVGNAKGSLIVGNATDSVALAAATDGYIPSYLAAAGTGVGIQQTKLLPLTADTDVGDNRVPRLDRPAGTEVPSPLQASKMVIEDSGAIRASGSGGNARGTNAVDLQVARGAATQVASGNRSFIGAGENNTAATTESVVVGGDSNSATTGDRAAVVGGSGNTASNTEAFVGGGQNNTAAGVQSTVCGGDGNGISAAGTEAVIGGGFNNVASAQHATIAGGATGTASAVSATVGGGSSNAATGVYSTVPGGTANIASGPVSTAVGYGAVADNYGEFAHAAGYLTAVGDAQVSELIWKAATSNATPAEAFLSTAGSDRAVIADSRGWGFSGYMTVRKSDGTMAFSKFEGAIRRGAGAGTTTLVGVTNTLLQDESGGTWGLAAAYAFTADTANGSLKLTVTGTALTNLYWMAVARIFKLK